MSFRAKLNTVLRRYFFGGILVIVPLIITILVLRFLFKGIDGLLSPFIAELIGYKVPGGGVDHPSTQGFTSCRVHSPIRVPVWAVRGRTSPSGYALRINPSGWLTYKTSQIHRTLGKVWQERR